MTLASTLSTNPFKLYRAAFTLYENSETNNQLNPDALNVVATKKFDLPPQNMLQKTCEFLNKVFTCAPTNYFLRGNKTEGIIFNQNNRRELYDHVIQELRSIGIDQSALAINNGPSYSTWTVIKTDVFQIEDTNNFLYYRMGSIAASHFHERELTSVAGEANLETKVIYPTGKSSKSLHLLRFSTPQGQRSEPETVADQHPGDSNDYSEV